MSEMKNPCSEIELPIKIIVQRRFDKYQVWYGRINEGARYKITNTLEEIGDTIISYLKGTKE